jgi:hypothetical protein
VGFWVLGWLVNVRRSRGGTGIDVRNIAAVDVCTRVISSARGMCHPIDALKEWPSAGHDVGLVARRHENI